MQLIYFISNLMEVVMSLTGKSDKTRFFAKCFLNDKSSKTFSCTQSPTNVSITSSKLGCAKQCTSISTGQNMTIGNQLPSSLYTLNDIDNETIVNYKQFSFSPHRFHDVYPVIGDIQVCMGFNYQATTGLCQLFDQYCPMKNLILLTNSEMGLYYGVIILFSRIT